MTQEEKELLLKDLCARWPYGVKMSNINAIHNGLNLPPITVDVNDYENSNPLVLINSGFRPYLRPMSSMTKEEKKEYDNFLFDNLEREAVIGYEDKAFGIDVIMRYRSWEVVQWLLEHHLDFNGLIDLGLAIEAPNDMYKKGI